MRCCAQVAECVKSIGWGVGHPAELAAAAVGWCASAAAPLPSAGTTVTTRRRLPVPASTIWTPPTARHFAALPAASSSHSGGPAAGLAATHLAVSAVTASGSSSSGAAAVSNGAAGRSAAAAGPLAPGSTRPAAAPKVDDYIGATIDNATMMAQLRRLMLRYRAMLLPRHVVGILLAMERICGGRRAPDIPAPAPPPLPGSSGISGSSALRTVRVQPASAPVAATNLESQAPERQVIIYMMGDLGKVIWSHLDEFDAAALADCLWCWARLSWHPEPQLLSEVAHRFASTVAHPSAAPIGPPDLVRGVWALGALDSLGAAELEALLPALRAAAPALDAPQLRAVSRALGGAAAAAEEEAGGAAGGDGDVGAEAMAVASEFGLRAEAMRSGAAAAPAS